MCVCHLRPTFLRDYYYSGCKTGISYINLTGAIPEGNANLSPVARLLYLVHLLVL
jgi:hypothetical protein